MTPVPVSSKLRFMDATAQVQPAATRLNTWLTWAGRVVSVAPVFILLWSARMKLTHDAWYVREWSRSAGRLTPCRAWG
jgi:hypothetical protein